MRRFIILAVLCALPIGTAAQTDFSKVEMKATKVAGNVYMLEGAGGNIGVSVGTDGILIVDDQFAPLADKIRAALKGLNQGKLRFILNTHWHVDLRLSRRDERSDGQEQRTIDRSNNQGSSGRLARLDLLEPR